MPFLTPGDMSGHNYIRDMFGCAILDESVTFNPRPICHATINSALKAYNVYKLLWEHYSSIRGSFTEVSEHNFNIYFTHFYFRLPKF